MATKEDITKAAVKELIIGFGVLEGLWIYAKVNPLEEILKALKPLIQGTQFEWYYPLAWITLFIAIPVVQVIATYKWGGMVGLLSLLLAFIGGVLINAVLGILLVFGGMFLGYYSFSTKRKITIAEFTKFISSTINYFRR